MASVAHEQRMLIDGKLVDGQAGTFSVINPATEQSIGEVSDGSKEDMQQAIDAARRAFDETDWATNHKFRQQCLLQLHEAIEAEKEELREAGWSPRIGLQEGIAATVEAYRATMGDRIDVR